MSIRATMCAAVSIALLLTTGCGRPSDDGQEMVDALRTLLPQGTVTQASAQPVTRSGGSAEMVFDDGHGAARIAVALGRQPVPVPSTAVQCPDTAYNPYSECTTSTEPDGSRIDEITGPADTDQPDSGPRSWTARLTMHDGGQVVAMQANAADPSTGPATRAVPPLSRDQLRMIATAAVWQQFLARIPTQPRIAAQAPTPRTSTRIVGVLAPLLPNHLRVADPGGSDEFGHVTVDDGHGKSLVAVTAQKWRPDDPAILDVFTGGQILPDGTRVKTSMEPPAQAGADELEWTVDTLRSNGLRIAISSVNARAYNLPAGRTSPALTISQLQQIALDPHWQSLSR
jgi:hypothetical protein